MRLFFNFALKLSLTASSFTILTLTSIGMLISFFYFLHFDDDFTAIEGLESIFGGFCAGVFWIRTREMNSRLFFKLKIFYLTFFNTLFCFVILAVFYKLSDFLNFQVEEFIQIFIFSLILMITALLKLYLANLFEELIFTLLFSL